MSVNETEGRRTAPDEAVRNLARSSARAGTDAAECAKGRVRLPAAPRVLAALSLALIVASAGYLALDIGANGGTSEQLAYPQGDAPATDEGVSSAGGSDAGNEPDSVPVGDAQGEGAVSAGDSSSGPQNGSQGSAGAQGGSLDGHAGSGKPGVQQPGGSGGPGDGSSQGDTAPAPPKPETVTVTISVDSSAADGSVSSSGTFTFDEGATVYDALCALGLPVGSQQSMHGVYVSSIGGLAEKQFGASSGWVYAVNGKQPSVSCGACALKDGDAIQWRYVTG